MPKNSILIKPKYLKKSNKERKNNLDSIYLFFNEKYNNNKS